MTVPSRIFDRIASGVKTSMARLGQLKEAWVEAMQCNDMELITYGKAHMAHIVEPMSKKGWQIDIIESKVISAVGRGIAIGSITTEYTASKGAHRKGGREWYKDLCDVLGYRSGALPEFARPAWDRAPRP